MAIASETRYVKNRQGMLTRAMLAISTAATLHFVTRHFEGTLAIISSSRASMLRLRRICVRGKRKRPCCNDP